MNPTRMIQLLREKRLERLFLEGDEKMPEKTLSYEEGIWIITKFDPQTGQILKIEEGNLDIAKLEVNLLFAKQRRARHAAKKKENDA